MTTRRYTHVLPVRLHHICTYCGCAADSRDHFLSWAESGIPYVLPSCRRCNGWLGRKRHWTLGERCEYLASKMLRRHGKDIHKDWDRIIVGTTGSLKNHLIKCREWSLSVAVEFRWMEYMKAFADVDLTRLYPRSDEAASIVCAIDYATAKWRPYAVSMGQQIESKA